MNMDEERNYLARIVLFSSGLMSKNLSYSFLAEISCLQELE